MARMRKAARVWRNPAAQALARRVTIADDGAVFEVDPKRLFFRAAPVEVELGAGIGDFLIERAAASPERNFLAVELAGAVARMLAVRVARCELANIKVLRADARTLVNLLLPDHSVSAFHVYFPDPWPKQRHVKHRLFNPWFASNLKRTLDRASGRLFVATDVGDYASEIARLLEAEGFVLTCEPAPGAGRTNFGRKYQHQGRTVFSSAYRVRGEEETNLASALP